MTKQTHEQFSAEMEERSREIEVMKGELFTELGLSDTPTQSEREQLTKRSQMLFDLLVLDLSQNTFLSAPTGIPLDRAKNMAATNDPNMLTIVVPAGYELVNRKELAAKLGAIASQLLDVAMGESEGDEADSIATAFNEAVSG